MTSLRAMMVLFILPDLVDQLATELLPNRLTKISITIGIHLKVCGS